MSDRAFAILTPANPLTRLAFSDVYEALNSLRQNTQTDGIQAALGRMSVECEQRRDAEVVRLRRELSKPYDNDGEASESLTEPDTDTEEQLHVLGMIWVGHYVLELQSPPAVPERGWAAGKGPLENVQIDLLLCTRLFAKLHNISLRNPHARFNFFPENKGLFVTGCSGSPSAQLAVNGDRITRRPYHLNQHKMKIQLDKLEYHFEWTKFAATDNFTAERKHYVDRIFGGVSPPYIDVEMPTPLLNKRMIGKWTLGDALGAGGQGRVFFASDSSGNVAAIKVMERTPRNCRRVDDEIQTLNKVTDLVKNANNPEQILRLAEVIYSNDQEISPQAAFDNVAIVLVPLTPKTFSDLVGTRSKGDFKGMTVDAATAFRSALLGLKVLHDKDWLHRDLKPPNIGLFDKSLHSVLLDVGTSRHIRRGTMLQPRPGTLGTIGYIAPELELKEYDHSIDIWAMGIILFELTYNYHPWKLAINPWRAGEKNEKLRADFQKSYQGAINLMASDYKSACASPAQGYIHLGGLFVDMVRHSWATGNSAPRPDIGKVLQHPAWGPLLPDPPRMKKRQKAARDV
ncbi:hypothetical protein PMIN01_11774 [Paraphaeosphaeria minitans]|uniref:Protein kinase domain-containing protein n=1 Tax=Paraphaeosphaeria minitans TaxID=565426 RepID=A0A9P6G755_9PLEO|nr:hypothetical protein PMIN01_11774 [Paraphaeosphaeria minitans]